MKSQTKDKKTDPTKKQKTSTNDKKNAFELTDLGSTFKKSEGLTDFLSKFDEKTFQGLRRSSSF